MVARIGSWQDNNLQIKAGREAVKMIGYYIKNDISFHQETTLSGKSIIMNINKAKEKGFFVVMNYIGLESAEIAKVRVKFRVSKGGHGIPDEFIQLINIKNGKLTWKDKIIPEWAKIILKQL